jgi:hypothetical protein
MTWADNIISPCFFKKLENNLKESGLSHITESEYDIGEGQVIHFSSVRQTLSVRVPDFDEKGNF